MRFMLLPLALFLLILPGAAGARSVPAGADQVGIYSAVDGTGVSYRLVPYYTTDAAYLCLTNCSLPAIGGWELRIDVVADGPMGVTVTGWFIPGIINVDEMAPDFTVALPTPLPPNEFGIMVLMQIQYFVMDAAYFYVGPVTDPLVEGQMSFLDGSDPGVVLPLYPSTGSFDRAVYAVNTEIGPVATDPTSWGAVRNLYR